MFDVKQINEKQPGSLYEKSKHYSEFKYKLWRFWDKIKYPFYRFYRQTKCIISYLPVLIRDRDWDGHYFLKLMRHKLARMERCIRTCDNHTCAQDDAANIKKAINILDRMISDNYDCVELDKHVAKWGEAQHSDIELPPNEDGEIFYEWKIEYPNAKTPEQKEQCSKDFRKAGKIAERKRSLDYKKFFAMLERHIREWWN